MMAPTEDAYDPLRVMTEAAESRNAAEQKLAKARDFFWEWIRPWSIRTATTESLMEIAKMLQHQDGSFWLEFLGCEIAYRKRVADLGLQPSVDTDLSFAAKVIAVKLLLSAVAGDEPALTQQLERVTAAGQLGSVPEAVGEIRDNIEHWVFGRSEPPTPWITAAELSSACRGQMKGFSEANVSKGLSGQLISEEPLGPKEKYRRFRHATEHRTMLHHLVAALKLSKTGNFIFSVPTTDNSPGLHN